MDNKLTINILKSNSFKILNISGDTGAALNKHKVDTNAVIIVKSGHLLYEEADRKVELKADDTCDIPPEVFHQVTCQTDDTRFMVIMALKAKLKFENK